ncbi:hypothetical protein [Nostoc sp.]|uniref:hypothetical protein n=1 Tax=Nostoc sp. TaxID=1180 RepID=UPI003FA55671
MLVLSPFAVVLSALFFTIHHIVGLASLLRLACDNIMPIGRVPSRGDLVMVLLNLLLNLAWIHQPHFCRYSNFPDWLATYLCLTKM